MSPHEITPSTINSLNLTSGKQIMIIKQSQYLPKLINGVLNQGLFKAWHIIKRNRKHIEKINKPRYKSLETAQRIDPPLKEYLKILDLLHSYLLSAARQILSTYASNNLRDGPWDLGLATWNVRGLQSTNKFYHFIKEMAGWMHKNNVHIFFIQEHNRNLYL